jgi:tetratricopeptide (TPR) repeat protein
MVSMRRNFLISLGFFALLVGCPSAPPSGEPLPSPTLRFTPEGSVRENPLATRQTSVLDEIGELNSEFSFEKALAVFQREGVDERLIPEERVVYGAVLLSQGRTDEARKQYQRVLQAQPNNPDALRVMAMFSQMDGNSTQQLDYLQRWARAFPQDPRPLAALGWAYLEQNKVDMAQQNFLASLRHGRTSEALAGMSQINLGQKKNDEALANIDEAINLDPSNDSWHALRHQILIKLERPQAAEQAISQAIQLSPGDPWHLLDRARLRYRTLYKSEQALEDLNQLLQIDPRNFFGLVYRAEILESQGKLEASYRDYRLAYQLKPEYDPIYPSMALLSFLFDDFPTAIKMAEESFKQHPGEWAFPVIQALSLRQLRREEEATRLLNRVSTNFQNERLVNELIRYIGNPRANFAMNSLLERETNEIVKTRVQFYLAYLNRLLGQQQAARSIFRLVGESRLRNIPEIPMARVMAARQ